MRMKLFASLLVGLGMGLGITVGTLEALRPNKPAPPPEDMRPVVERLREIARLETLEVSVYRKVRFEPAIPKSEGALGDVANWARQTLAPRKGRAVVFADALLSVDLRRVDARATGNRVVVVIPDVLTRVILKPAETEILESNLRPDEHQAMLSEALDTLQREVSQDRALRARAKRSAQRALEDFLKGAGYQEVVFVDALPPLPVVAGS